GPLTLPHKPARTLSELVAHINPDLFDWRDPTRIGRGVRREGVPHEGVPREGAVSDAAILERLKAGDSVSQITRELKVGYRRVSRIRDEAGIAVKKGGGDTRSVNVDDGEILAALREGMTVKQITKTLR